MKKISTLGSEKMCCVLEKQVGRIPTKEFLEVCETAP